MAALPRTTPSIGVVIATHNRPELVRRAVDSVLAQDFAGAISVMVVYDRAEPDTTMVREDAHRRVSVTANTRTPGLAGARNTGILAVQTDLIAFCDDDDTWLPNKLTAQLERLDRVAGAEFVTTAMTIDYSGTKSVIRRAGADSIGFDDLIRSRMSMLHSSSFVFRREAMLGTNGFG